MTWRQGDYFNLGKEFETALWLPDSRGCFHLVGRDVTGKLWHFVRGSKGPYPIDAGRVITDNARGVADMFISPTFGNLEVASPSNMGFRTYYADPLSFPDPSDEGD